MSIPAGTSRGYTKRIYHVRTRTTDFATVGLSLRNVKLFFDISQNSADRTAYLLGFLTKHLLRDLIHRYAHGGLDSASQKYNIERRWQTTKDLVARSN